MSHKRGKASDVQLPKLHIFLPYSLFFYCLLFSFILNPFCLLGHLLELRVKLFLVFVFLLLTGVQVKSTIEYS